MCFGANVVANEKNNYAFTSTITLPPVTVAAMSDLTFDWSALTKDFLGHPLHPATDVGTAILMILEFPARPARNEPERGRALHGGPRGVAAAEPPGRRRDVGPPL